MIIFDLDGTLADCEHRQHFIIDPCDTCHDCWAALKFGGISEDYKCPACNRYPAGWKGPDWQAFYEACDQDKPIDPAIEILRSLWIKEGLEIEIWSGRCESLWDKTLEWITSYVFGDYDLCPIKMRPIGDNASDDQLKERWLDEYLNSNEWTKKVFENRGKCPIDFVFDAEPNSIHMWRRHSVFVFNCNQKEKF